MILIESERRNTVHTPRPAPDLDLTALISDAHWLSFGFNPDQTALFFLHADDDLMEASVFINGRWLHERPFAAFPLAEVSAASRSIALEATAPAPQGLVLHTAFCCSTLFARCLQNPGVTRVLRELPLYSGLPRARAMLLERYGDLDLWRQLIELTAALSHRRFAGESATFNKPGNTFLGAASDFLGTATACRGVLLHGDLPAFLLSAAKKIDQGRAPWLAMLAGLNPDPAWIPRSGIDPAQAHPIQLAALIWHVQMAMIGDLSRDTCAQRLRHLDTKTFLDDPHLAIAAAQTWLAPHSATPVPAHFIDSELQRDAKHRGAGFTQEKRRAEAREIRERYASILDDALAWSEKTFGPWERAYDFDLQPLSAVVR
jgi:hypothetical protein